MTSSRRKGLLAALSSAWLALLLFELGLRIADYDPLGDFLDGKSRVLRLSRDERMRYEHTPSVEGIGWGTQVKINSHGFRDVEWEREKGERLRVCVLGDSITFGSHLELRETYPKLLQRDLKGLGTTAPVEVLNMGMVGYDTVQEVALLERTGVGLDPDLVVVGFCVDDLGFVSYDLEHDWSKSDGTSLLYKLRVFQLLRAFSDRFKRSELSEAMQSDEVYARVFEDEIGAVNGTTELQKLLSSLRADLRAARPKSLQATGLATRVRPEWFDSPPRIGRLCYALDELARLANKHRFKAVLLIIPYLEENEFFRKAYAIVRHLAEKRGIEVVEVDTSKLEVGLEALRLAPEDPVLLTARGHSILAQRLLDYIATLGWLESQ